VSNVRILGLSVLFQRRRKSEETVLVCQIYVFFCPKKTIKYRLRRVQNIKILGITFTNSRSLALKVRPYVRYFSDKVRTVRVRHFAVR